MKVRKKPVVVDAWRIDALLDVVALGEWHRLPAEVLAAVRNGTLKMEVPHHVFVHTIEGVMRGNKTDWLIRGVKGEFYPCKPSVFDETYEVMFS